VTTFRIDVVIDPAQSAPGVKVVERQLDGLEREAAELRQALVNALSVRDAGSAAALGRIETLLAETQERALVTDARISQLGKDINTRGVRNLNRELERTRGKANEVASALRSVAAGVSAGLVVREFAQLSDQLTNAQNRLRLVTGSSQELAATQEALLGIAERTRSSFGGTAEIFNRLAVSGKELGVSNQQLLDFTTSLNQAIILSGASAQEANAGLIQLSQGLASGTLRGDELRSVLEQLPAVADVIAKGLGVTRGELRKLGEAGQITAGQVLKAFASARGELNDRFATTVPTISQQFEVLTTAVTRLVERVNEAIGLNRGLGLFIEGVATLVDSQRLEREALASTEGDLDDLGKSYRFVTEKIADLNRRLEENGVLTDTERSILTDLTGRIATLDAQAKTYSATKAEEAKTAAAQVAAEKQRKEALAAQEDALKKLRGPLEEYLVTQQALNVLLEAGRITQSEYNRALEDARPPEPQKAPEAVDPFAAQVQSLRDQNIELSIRASNLSDQRDLLLAEFELGQKGVQLTDEQRAQLADLLARRRELTAAVDAQKKKEEDLAQLGEAQDKRIDRLREQITTTDQIKQQIEDLIVLKTREKELTDEVDAQIAALRLRQLQGATDLASGFERAFARIAAEANDLASVGEDIVNVFANNATNAIIEFARTGEFSFKAFASAILEDITRIIARLLVVQAITAAVNAFGGGTGAGGTTALLGAAGVGQPRAQGGTVQPGTAYPVGEEGPELFVPNRTGTIVPNPASVQPAPQPVTVQVVNVQNPNAVPDAIAEGLADEAIVNVLTRKRETIRQLAV